MKLAMPQGLGAEPKKVMWLAALVVVGGGIVYWANSGSNLPPGAVAQKATTVPGVAASINSSQRAADAAVAGAAINGPNTKRVTARSSNGGRSGDDFHPSLKLPEDVDVNSIDPTLKVALLAKVRAVGDVGGRRSLFEFYNPPPPPPKVEPIKPAPPPPPVKPVVSQSAASANAKAATPPPPPIPFKFYGMSGSQRDAHKRGLFVDGDEIFIQPEDGVIRNRYKVVRLGVSSAEVEDLVAKNRQTLPLVEPVEK